MVKNFLSWVFSRGERERRVNNEAEKLKMSMRTTAKCRYNASVRLSQQGKFSFFTTTILSLGLIFIPLMQNAGIPLAYEPNVLNVMQTFLGVSVLVYSVVIGTARYEVRSTQLNECGDKLKELIRELAKEIERNNQNPIDSEILAKFQKRYSDIVTDVENHNRDDYMFATLEMRQDYYITGIPRLMLWLQANINRLFIYMIPITLIFTELIFIFDMIGATSILTDYLSGRLVSS